MSFAAVKRLLAAVEDPDPRVMRDRLLALFPEMVSPYVAASSELAAVWYEESRAQVVSGRPFTPVVVAGVASGQSSALVRHSLTPLFQGSTSTVLSLLAGGTQRMVANGARDTIMQSAIADPVRVGYARIPRPGCCAFCGMLASRGAVYSSREAAGGVVGRGVDPSETAGKVGGQGAGRKARGSRVLGASKFHDHCHCVTAPVFSGDNEVAQVVQATQDKFLGMYQDASATELSEYSRRDPSNAQFGSVTAKATLANWRQVHGTK